MKVVCPKCNSDQITANQKGFSGGKAVAGALLTGGIGLIAGMHGSKKVIITCLACGNKFKPGEGKNISEPGDVHYATTNVAVDGNPESLTDLDILTSFEVTDKGLLHAISFVKNKQKISLSEAKAYVDDLIVRRKLTPKSYSPEGCGGKVATILIIVVCSLLYFLF